MINSIRKTRVPLRIEQEEPLLGLLGRLHRERAMLVAVTWREERRGGQENGTTRRRPIEGEREHAMSELEVSTRVHGSC